MPNTTKKESLFMNKREEIIRLYFDMWLQNKDLGFDDIFTDDVLYIESWGPKYNGLDLIKHWFKEWNSRAEVLSWDIKQYFHSNHQTVVEWYFCSVDGGIKSDMDGVSIIEWTDDDKIKYLKEFACDIRNYNPYENGEKPEFR